MKPEQQAEEILVLQGFAEPEDLEPEVAELLNDISRRIRELARLLSHYEWPEENDSLSTSN